MERPIAVFDSGLGGLSVLRALRRRMPHERFLYFGDSANAPYGSRPTEEIRALTLRHAGRLFEAGAKALVVACNTATSAAIGELRAQYPQRIIVGIEPALKLAVERHPHGCILVMATEATLRERKFSALTERYSGDCTIRRCPCPGLVEFVERGELDSPALDAHLRRELSPFLTPQPDAVVLGCTHYPFLRRAIARAVGASCELLDGADGTARETLRRLTEAGLLRTQGAGGVELTDSEPAMLPLAERLLNAE